MAVSIADLLKTFDHIRFRKGTTSAFSDERAQPRKYAFKCPVCDSQMQVRAENVLPKLESAPIELHEMECDSCGMVTERLFRPAKGYDSAVIAHMQGVSGHGLGR